MDEQQLENRLTRLEEGKENNMTKFYSIPLETANKLVDYLLKRPYHEVAELIKELNHTAVMLEAPANAPDKDELKADRIESGNLIAEAPSEVE